MSKKWKLIKSRPVFESRWMKIEKRTYKLPNGKIGGDYYHLKRPDYVLVIAVDNKERIVVLRQYRRGVDDFVYELPAGWIDKGEEPIDAAVRELKEESGFKAKGEIEATLYPQPAFSSMKAYVAILKIDSEKVTVKKLGNDEHISHELVSLNQIKKMIKKKQIKDMGFLSALAVYENT